MAMKQAAAFLVLLALAIGYGWYGFLVNPARPTDIYPPGPRR